MKDKKDCKIVQDLLPNYIEKLTSEDTNKYIEEHLKECKECSDMLDAMKNEITNNENNSNKKEVKYLKKYSKKVTILRTIIIAIVLIFVFMIVRKIVILYNLQNKISKYENCDNFYVRTYFYNDDMISIHHAYRKENNIKVKIQGISASGTNCMTMYGHTDTEFSNLYIETNGAKIAGLNTTTRLGYIESPIGYTQTDSFWDLILLALSSNITTEKCNGKECYKIEYTALISGGDINRYRETHYVEKETGLLVRLIDTENIGINNNEEAGQIHDYKYEFGTVTDEEFIEPDISEYEVKQGE